MTVYPAGCHVSTLVAVLGWNSRARGYDVGRRVHAVFGIQVARTPLLWNGNMDANINVAVSVSKPTMLTILRVSDLSTRL